MSAPAVETETELHAWLEDSRGGHTQWMDAAEVEQWFENYLEDYAALGRGESDDAGSLMAFYGVPLILSTDAACLILTDESQVRGAAKQQVDALRSSGYHHSEVLDSQTITINASSCTHRARFARVRADGSQIAQIEVTYLIGDTAAGPRIFMLAVHSPR